MLCGEVGRTRPPTLYTGDGTDAGVRGEEDNKAIIRGGRREVARRFILPRHGGTHSLSFAVSQKVSSRTMRLFAIVLLVAVQLALARGGITGLIESCSG